MMADVDALMTYAEFVAERHQVYLRRASGTPGPWTEDEILRRAKFTNVFRWLDAQSQFLIRELLRPEDPKAALFRSLMFRFTNRSEPWEAYRVARGDYPDLDALLSGDLLRFWRDEYAGPVFGTAYRIFAHPRRDPSISQLEWIVDQVRGFMADSDRVAAYLSPGPGEEKVSILSTIPRVGDFMGMQVLTDVGYSGAIPWYDEDDWVTPGPGAIAGARALDMRPQDAIQWSLLAHRRGSLRIELAGRTLSRMDIQNTLCEFSKYHRYLTGGGVPRGYTPSASSNSTFVLPYRAPIG